VQIENNKCIKEMAYLVTFKSYPEFHGFRLLTDDGGIFIIAVDSSCFMNGTSVSGK
jgi:hypothetical protein